MVRQPAVAGSFYAGGRSALEKQVAGCFSHRLGPGSPPALAPERRGNLLGLVVPHAGYGYSGPVAAHSYGAAAADGFPALFFVIGPNHHYGPAGGVATTAEDFLTPLGTAKVDAAAAKRLAKGLIENNAGIQADEHSIEVQVPFLQYISPRFAFVPVCMGMQDIETAVAVGRAVASVIRDSGMDAVIVASSDFTHCGPHYGQSPPRGKTAGAFAKEVDRKAIEAILRLDPAGLIRTVERESITMCGPGPVAAMLTAAKALGAGTARLLAYATSADISGDDDVAVGYGAVAVGR